MISLLGSLRGSELEALDKRYAELQDSLKPLWLKKIRSDSGDFVSE
jgi:hypothetical protein